MENNSTPGPWRISGSAMFKQGKIQPLIEHGDSEELSPLIAEVYADGGRLPAQANTQLIAASPTMLEALQKARIFIEDELQTRELSALPEPNNDEAHYITDAQETLDSVRLAIEQATQPNPFTQTTPRENGGE